MKSKFTHLHWAAVSLLFALHVGLAPDAYGGVVVSRGDLVAQLGAVAVTEEFETFLFPTNTAKRVGTVLDTNSVIDGQGPGLVRQGVRFLQSPPGEGLQWDRQFEYGLQSAALVTDGQLIIDFTSPVTHVGFDMFWFDVGFPLANPGTVQVFAADDISMLYSTNIFEPFAPDSFFFGYTDSRGIGRVVLFRDEGEEVSVSPIIDHLTFGFVPSLSIALTDQQVLLSWPELATGYQLEATTNLTALTGWMTVTNVPVPLNGKKNVTLPVTETRKFFRLHSP